MQLSIPLESLSLLRSDDLVPSQVHSLVDITCPGSCRRSARIVASIRQVDARAWDQLTAGLGLYAQRGFLEGAARDDLDGAHRYVLFSQDGVPTGVASVRLTRFHGPALASILPARPLAHWLARGVGVAPGPMALPVLVCSTSFGCGGTGLHFVDGVEPRDALAQLRQALGRIIADPPAGQRPVGLVLEEPTEVSRGLRSALGRQGFAALPTSPRMVLDLDPSWRDFDDYLAALKSKFRVKAKRAYTKSKQLESRVLSTKEVVLHQARLRELVAGVVDQAGFHLSGGSADALAPWMRGLGADMVVQGYFLEGELVGFLTAFERDGMLDAHSVGFDYGLNRAHSIYPRMLYDYLRIALERGLNRVDYGRTAQEIKSTVGAVPVATRSHLRHRSEVVNPLLGLITAGIQPPQEPQRRPFKAQAPARRAA
jgi:hypothetical protein